MLDGEPFACSGAYVRGAGGGIGEDAMEAGLGRDAPGEHEADDNEDLKLSRSCAGLVQVYFRKMQGVRAGCRPSHQRNTLMNLGF
jgi:hypothetical protein